MKAEEKRGGKKERVLSIVLQEISPSFFHACDVIIDTVITNGFGVRSSKDFLVPGYTRVDKTIRRGHNSHKRRCLSINLALMPFKDFHLTEVSGKRSAGLGDRIFSIAMMDSLFSSSGQQTRQKLGLGFLTFPRSVYVR